MWKAFSFPYSRWWAGILIWTSGLYIEGEEILSGLQVAMQICRWSVNPICAPCITRKIAEKPDVILCFISRKLPLRVRQSVLGLKWNGLFPGRRDREPSAHELNLASRIMSCCVQRNRLLPPLANISNALVTEKNFDITKKTGGEHFKMFCLFCLFGRQMKKVEEEREKGRKVKLMWQTKNYSSAA